MECERLGKYPLGLCWYDSEGLLLDGFRIGRIEGFEEEGLGISSVLGIAKFGVW